MKKPLTTIIIASLLLSFLILPSIQTIYATSWGFTSPNTSSKVQVTDTIRGVSYAVSSTVAVYNLTAYMDFSIGTKAQGLIYYINGSYVGKTDEKIATSTTTGWVTFNFTTRPILYAGETYVYAVWCDSGATSVYFDTEVGTFYDGPATYNATSPPSTATFSTNAFAVSIYVDVFTFNIIDVAANTTVANKNFTLSTSSNNVTQISHYIYCTNNTGVLSNSSTTAATNQSLPITGTWNDTSGVVIQVTVYANSTENIWDSYTEYVTVTNTVPSYFQYAALPIQQGYPCNFTSQWTDNVGLSGFIFESNITGTATNETWSSLSDAATAWANFTDTLPNVEDAVVTFCYYVNDTSGEWGTTGNISFTVMNTAAPEYSNVTYSTTAEGAACSFSVLWQGLNGLSGYIFSSNTTGSWVNHSYAQLYNNPDYAITLTSLPSAPAVVGYRWYANDTDGNWGDTGILTFSVTSSVVATAGGGGNTYVTEITQQVSEPTPQPQEAPKINNFIFVVGVVAIITVSALVFFSRNIKAAGKRHLGGEWPRP